MRLSGEESRLVKISSLSSVLEQAKCSLQIGAGNAELPTRAISSHTMSSIA